MENDVLETQRVSNNGLNLRHTLIFSLEKCEKKVCLKFKVIRYSGKTTIWTHKLSQ